MIHLAQRGSAYGAAAVGQQLIGLPRLLGFPGRHRAMYGTHDPECVAAKFARNPKCVAVNSAHDPKAWQPIVPTIPRAWQPQSHALLAEPGGTQTMAANLHDVCSRKAACHGCAHGCRGPV